MKKLEGLLVSKSVRGDDDDDDEAHDEERGTGLRQGDMDM